MADNTNLAEEGADEGVVVGVESGRVELVALEAEAGDRGRTRVGAGRRPAEAEDRPTAGRDIPDEVAGGREFVREVDDPRRIDGRTPGKGGKCGWRRQEGSDPFLGRIWGPGFISGMLPADRTVR